MTAPEERILTGIGSSAGIGIAKALVVEPQAVPIIRVTLERTQVDKEIDRLNLAVDRARKDLGKVKRRLSRLVGDEHSYIFDAHLLMLEDQQFIDSILGEIRNSRVNADWAVREVVQRFRKLFDSLDDEYMRERQRDVVDVGTTIQRNLSGLNPPDFQKIETDVILVAENIAATDTIHFQNRFLRGFATEVGGRTSHLSILARSLELPAVVGVRGITHEIKSGDPIIIDGETGKVIVHPQTATRRTQRKRRIQLEKARREYLKNRDLPAVTLDGHEIDLQANIEFPHEVDSALRHGASGIGLFRSEYLLLNRKEPDVPSEEEHFQVYQTIGQSVLPHSAVIRTFDVGGDKFAQQFGLAGERNPVMGLRAIRLCLRNPEIFRPQVRALLRASYQTRIKIMFPFVSGIEEVRAALAILEEEKENLAKEGIPFNEEIRTGIMIEIPSAALTADLLAREVDFFSIGTNDLIQYSLAIDRGNENVSYLYQPLHPALLRTLKFVIEAAHREGKKVGMCGEMASDPIYAYILLGLGLDELSMNPVSIPFIKKTVRASHIEEASELAKELLRLSTPREILKRLDEHVPWLRK